MGKRQKNLQAILSKIDTLSDNEVSEVLDFISGIEDKRPEPAAWQSSDDDLLLSLVSARENLRARQVFEWESIRRRAEARSSR